MKQTRPLRVLHTIDTLGGGGSERLIWDIVRLSDPARVKHRVVTIFPDGYLGPFVYAERLRELGAYSETRLRKRSLLTQEPLPVSSRRDEDLSAVTRVARRLNLPRGLKAPLVGIWNSFFSLWYRIRRAAVHLRSMFTIVAQYMRFRPDIIHTHGFYDFKYGLVFKVLFGRPTVHVVPCLFSQMEAQHTGWLASRYRRFHHLVDCFALDPGYRDELLGVGVPDQKLLDINGTLDLDAIAFVRAERNRHRLEVRQTLGIPDDAIIALSVGRLDRTKGHSHALEALPLMLERLPALHWVVLGEGQDRAQLEKRIQELRLEQHAHLVGFDPNPLPYYAAADIFLRTTTMEGENISSRQAIAMGLPAVGFDTTCETDLITKLGHGVLVSNGDESAFAAAVCEILSLPDRGSSMAAAGVEYCNAHMSIQKHVADLVSVYAYLHEKGSSNRESTSALDFHQGRS